MVDRPSYAKTVVVVQGLPHERGYYVTLSWRLLYAFKPSIAAEESSSDNENLQEILIDARKRLRELKEPEPNSIKYARSKYGSESSYISEFLDYLTKNEHGVTIDPDAPVQESTVAHQSTWAKRKSIRLKGESSMIRKGEWR